MSNSRTSLYDYERVPNVQQHMVQLDPAVANGAVYGRPSLTQQPASRASKQYHSHRSDDKFVNSRQSAEDFSNQAPPIVPRFDSQAVTSNTHGVRALDASYSDTLDAPSRHGSGAKPSLIPRRDRMQSLPVGVSLRRPTRSTAPEYVEGRQHSLTMTNRLLEYTVAAQPQNLLGSAAGVCSADVVHGIDSLHDMSQSSQSYSAYDIERARRDEIERSLDQDDNYRLRAPLPTQANVRPAESMSVAEQRLSPTSGLLSNDVEQERHDMAVEHRLDRARTLSLDVDDIHTSAGATLDNRGGEREVSLRQNVEVRPPSVQQREGPAKLAQSVDRSVESVTVRSRTSESVSVGPTPSQRVGSSRAKTQPASVRPVPSRRNSLVRQAVSETRHVEVRQSVNQQQWVHPTQDLPVRHDHVEYTAPTNHREQLTIQQPQMMAQPTLVQDQVQQNPTYLRQTAMGDSNILRLRKYDGKTDVEEFIDDFLDLCGYYGWATDEARLQLRQALVGGARICKREISVSEILADLRRRFGVSMRAAVDEFDSLQQGNLTIQQLGDEVERLYRLFNRDVTSPEAQHRQMVKFLSSLNNPEIHRFVMLAQPKTLKDAISYAQQYGAPEAVCGNKSVAEVGTTAAAVCSTQHYNAHVLELVNPGIRALQADVSRLRAELQTMSTPDRSKKTHKPTRHATSDRQAVEKRCFLCNELGHLRRDCSQWHKQKSKQQPKLSESSDRRTIAPNVDQQESTAHHEEASIPSESESGLPDNDNIVGNVAQLAQGNTSAQADYAGILNLDHGQGVCAVTGPLHVYYLPGQVERQGCMFLLDTGSTLNLISRQIFEKLPSRYQSQLRPTTYHGVTASGDPLPYHGVITLSGRLRTVPFTAEFAVADIAQEAILGISFFTKNECGFSFNEAQFCLDGTKLKCVDKSGNSYVSDVQVL